MASKQIAMLFLGETIKPVEGNHKIVKLKSTQKCEDV
jgi:hypothetical protein